MREGNPMGILVTNPYALEVALCATAPDATAWTKANQMLLDGVRDLDEVLMVANPDDAERRDRGRTIYQRFAQIDEQMLKAIASATGEQVDGLSIDFPVILAANAVAHDGGSYTVMANLYLSGNRNLQEILSADGHSQTEVAYGFAVYAKVFDAARRWHHIWSSDSARRQPPPASSGVVVQTTVAEEERRPQRGLRALTRRPERPAQARVRA